VPMFIRSICVIRRSNWELKIYQIKNFIKQQYHCNMRNVYLLLVIILHSLLLIIILHRYTTIKEILCIMHLRVLTNFRSI